MRITDNLAPPNATLPDGRVTLAKVERPRKTKPSSPRKKKPVAPIPERGFVRLPQVLAVIPIGRTSWLKGVNEGKYPAPVRPSPFGRVSVWRVEDILAILEKTGGTP